LTRPSIGDISCPFFVGARWHARSHEQQSLSGVSGNETRRDSRVIVTRRERTLRENYITSVQRNGSLLSISVSLFLSLSPKATFLGVLVAIRAEPGRCCCAARQPPVLLVNGREREKNKRKIRKKKKKKGGRKQRRSNLTYTFDATLSTGLGNGALTTEKIVTRGRLHDHMLVPRRLRTANETRVRRCVASAPPIATCTSPRSGRSAGFARRRETPRSARLRGTSCVFVRRRVPRGLTLRLFCGPSSPSLSLLLTSYRCSSASDMHTRKSLPEIFSNGYDSFSRDERLDKIF